MKNFSHLNTACAILERYTGSVPFHHFLREYLRQDKKYGSKDRRNISRLCYSALRLGQSFGHLPIADKIIAGLFLCSSEEDAVTEQLLPDFKDHIKWNLDDKWKYLELIYPAKERQAGTSGMSALFPPGTPAFSTDLDSLLFRKSFFIQPDLFVRVRPGKAATVAQKMDQAGISYESLPPAALRLSPATRLDDLFVPDQELVIQDYSSQQTLNFIKGREDAIKTVWDACAASGGKSLLAWDTLPSVELTVSDMRKSILVNLSNRFIRAGIKRYNSQVIDLAEGTIIPFTQSFDLVIADVPCSGSGTWSRTPEQLVHFDPLSVVEYQKLQRRIIQRILPAVKPGGYLLYITCSVFRHENEDNVEFLINQPDMQLISQSLIKGYQLKADTMYAALLTRI